MADFKFLIDIVDTVSPMVTMAFGIYGSLNHTKPADGKLTRKGNIAIWGIIISGIITITVKSGNLYYKVQAQKAEQAQHHIQDSLQAAFQDSVAKKFERSINSLDSIKNSNVKTLSSLNSVADKEQATLANTQRGMNPLFPMHVEVNFTIDIAKSLVKYEGYHREAEEYIDTLAFFEKITQHLMRPHSKKHSVDTAEFQENILKEPPVSSPVNMLYYNAAVPKYIAFTFIHSFFISEFKLSFKKNDGAFNKKENNENKTLLLTANINQLIESLTSGHEAVNESAEIEMAELDVNNKTLHIKIITLNPVIDGNNSDKFISIYDLQNAVAAIEIQARNPDADIYHLNAVSLYTGYKFSRQTTLLFSGKDKTNKETRQLFSRLIKPEEIK